MPPRVSPLSVTRGRGSHQIANKCSLARSTTPLSVSDASKSLKSHELNWHRHQPCWCQEPIHRATWQLFRTHDTAQAPSSLLLARTLGELDSRQKRRSASEPRWLVPATKGPSLTMATKRTVSYRSCGRIRPMLNDRLSTISFLKLWVWAWVIWLDGIRLPVASDPYLEIVLR